MKIINLKENLWIHGFECLEPMEKELTDLIKERNKILYSGKTIEIDESQAKSFTQYFSDHKVYRNYKGFLDDAYDCQTALSSIFSACSDEYCIIYEKQMTNRYKLFRKKDNLILTSKDIKWIEFNDDGLFKEDFNEPKEGRSLLMSPFNIYYTWLTTPIKSFEMLNENVIHFFTENSEYELFKQY